MSNLETSLHLLKMKTVIIVYNVVFNTSLVWPWSEQVFTFPSDTNYLLWTIYGTEWPILCWCAIEELLTHSLNSSMWQHLCYTCRSAGCEEAVLCCLTLSYYYSDTDWSPVRRGTGPNLVRFHSTIAICNYIQVPRSGVAKNAIYSYF